VLVVLVGALHRRWDREVGFSASSLHKRAASAIRGREVGFSACFLACESKMNRFTCFLLLCLMFRLCFVYAKKRERNKTLFVIRAILCLGDFQKRNFLSCVRNMCCYSERKLSCMWLSFHFMQGGLVQDLGLFRWIYMLSFLTWLFFDLCRWGSLSFSGFVCLAKKWKDNFLFQESIFLGWY